MTKFDEWIDVNVEIPELDEEKYGVSDDYLIIFTEKCAKCSCSCLMPKNYGIGWCSKNEKTKTIEWHLKEHFLNDDYYPLNISDLIEVLYWRKLPDLPIDLKKDEEHD